MRRVSQRHELRVATIVAALCALAAFPAGARAEGPAGSGSDERARAALEAQAHIELLAVRVFLGDAAPHLAAADPAALAARALAHARAYAAAGRVENADFERAVAALIACLAGDDEDDLDRAVEALRKLPKALPLPSFRVSLCLAHAYRRRGMLPQALFFAEKALVLAPQSLEARRLKRAILDGLEGRR